MLVVEGHKVENAKIDTFENEIILTLSDAVVITPEVTDKGLFKTGIEFYTTIEGKEELCVVLHYENMLRELNLLS
jgi:hypothetical protein